MLGESLSESVFPWRLLSGINVIQVLVKAICICSPDARSFPSHSEGDKSNTEKQ
jgi:hypothetical protein